MNLETCKKIWQKAKDLYGWDEGNLYFFKSSKEYHRIKLEHYKQKVRESKSEKEEHKWRYHLEGEQMMYDGCDSYCKELEEKINQKSETK